MLKNRHTISSIKVNKRSIRPTSSIPSQNKPQRFSGRITSIITSLQKNVKNLKTYYNNREDNKNNTINVSRKPSNIRLQKVLQRNSSQSNLRPQSQNKRREDSSDHNQRGYGDIFQIRNFFQKINGRLTNNITELYQFYKKNMQKRQKSTRILASIDMSNPNMGLSLDVGKQSLLKQQMQNHREYRQFIKEQQSRQSQIEKQAMNQNKLQSLSNIQKSRTHEKTSNLANDLLRKGLYDMANVTNLLINKKYRLTKEKEESFQLAKQIKEKSKAFRPQQIKKENDRNIANTPIKSEEEIGKELSDMKVALERQNIKQLQQSISGELNKNFQFDQPIVTQSNNQSHSKSNNSQSKRGLSKIKEFEISSIKKIQKSQKKSERSQLEESPIVPQRGKDFKQSKFYVQPIPFLNKKSLKQQSSISLQSNSRIIDVDFLPFDL